MRNTLEQSKIDAKALSAMEKFHSEYVKEVEEAIKNNPVVIVGMKQNPVVTKARKVLNDNNIAFKYIEYGSYFSKWKPRLAIKLWSGWPTFPMVFIDGKLVGGCKELIAHLEAKKSN